MQGRRVSPGITAHCVPGDPAFRLLFSCALPLPHGPIVPWSYGPGTRRGTAYIWNPKTVDRCVWDITNFLSSFKSFFLECKAMSRNRLRIEHCGIGQKNKKNT